MKMIEVEDLTFRYNKNGPAVLRNVSFACEKGSVNVIIGLNGSGKTTLMKIITGLLEKYEGTVIIKDKNIAETSASERSRLVSYVPQKVGAADDYTVFEYLLFGKVNSVKFYKTPDAAVEKRVKELAGRFRITRLLDKKVGEISGGERQMVSICSAIVQDAEVMILDEPISALDVKNQEIILNLIKTVAETENKTVLLSSHNPNHALYLNGCVLLLKDGALIKEGSAKEIITVENLKDIYGDNIKYSKDLDYNEISF